MTDLHIRRIDFGFDRTIPFQWLPSHPKFGMTANAISVLAIAFERFIVRSLSAARPLITDAGLLEETNAFLSQEAQHAKNHRRHLACLIEQYPGLQETVDEVSASFDEIIATEPLKYQLAYTAALESTFTPIFKVMLDHEDVLFRPGDERVASLFLWHFVEEVEHRSSALIIYDGLIGDPWYRTRMSRKVFTHVMDSYRHILRGFEKHVPADVRGASYPELSPAGMRKQEILARVPLPAWLRRRWGGLPPSTFHPASNLEMLTLFYRLFLSQVPFHDPAREPLPAFAATWFALWRDGGDITRFFTAQRQAA